MEYKKIMELVDQVKAAKEKGEQLSISKFLEGYNLEERATITRVMAENNLLGVFKK